MDLSRLRHGELLAAVAALGLLGVLALDWTAEETGYGALGPVSLVLLAVPVAFALALAVATLTRQPVAVPVAMEVMTAFSGILATLFLLVRLLFLDDREGLVVAAGLVLLALVALGGWLAMADERMNARESARGEIPVRPAPPASA